MADLANLADVKAWLQTGQNEIGATDDALVSRLITAASAWIETYLSRSILTANYAETRVAVGTQTIVFGNSPVTAVGLVVVDTLTIPALPALVPAPPGFSAPVPANQQSGYWFTPTALMIRGYAVPRNAMVTLQYTAGYAAVPVDIAQACIELVAYRYKSRDRIGVSTQSMGGVQTSSFRITDMMPETRTALNQYRNVVPVSPFARMQTV